MAYVRQRTTKTGAISTALVEAYRDANGRPRQRLLANLHGEPDALRGLARLVVRRAVLRKEQRELWTMGGADGVRGAIDGLLAMTGAQLGVLKKHCPATFREIRAAVRAYKGELEAAVTYTMGGVTEQMAT